jgi:hypothetical protein
MSSYSSLLSSHSSLCIILAIDRVVTWTPSLFLCYTERAFYCVPEPSGCHGRLSHEKPPSAGDLESVLLLPLNLPYFIEDSRSASNS